LLVVTDLCLLVLAAVEVSSSFLENVELGYPTSSAAQIASVVLAIWSRFLENGPESREAAVNEGAPVAFDAFVCKTIPEEEDV